MARESDDLERERANPTIDWSAVDFDAAFGEAHWTATRREETGARIRRALEDAVEKRRAERMATYDESGDEEESMERMARRSRRRR